MRLGRLVGGRRGVERCCVRELIRKLKMRRRPRPSPKLLPRRAAKMRKARTQTRRSRSRCCPSNPLSPPPLRPRRLTRRRGCPNGIVWTPVAGSLVAFAWRGGCSSCSTMPSLLSQPMSLRQSQGPLPIRRV